MQISKLMPPLKLVFVISSLNIGGVERQIVDTAPALIARGFKIIVYCFTEPGALAPLLQQAGIRVVAPQAGPAMRLGPWVRKARFVRSVGRLFSLLVKERPAAVHCFLPLANVFGLLAARAAGIRCVLTSRRSLNRYQAKYPWLSRLERRLHRHATAVVANSYAAARELVAEEGAPLNRVIVIHNGIALDKFDVPIDPLQVRAQLGIPADALIIIIVANLIPYKGHLDLLVALDRIKRKLPDGWRLLVVGRDDGAGPSIYRAAVHNGLVDNLMLLGVRTDVPALLGAANIAVLASEEEGFPNAILEYMAAGLPVIATDVGGTSEAIGGEDVGWLVPAGDTAAMAEALLTLATDAPLRRRMGTAGHARVRAQFSIGSCADAYAELYRRVLVADVEKTRM